MSYGAIDLIPEYEKSEIWYEMGKQSGLTPPYLWTLVARVAVYINELHNKLSSICNCAVDLESWFFSRWHRCVSSSPVSFWRSSWLHRTRRGNVYIQDHGGRRGIMEVMEMLKRTLRNLWPHPSKHHLFFPLHFSVSIIKEDNFLLRNMRPKLTAVIVPTIIGLQEILCEVEPSCIGYCNHGFNSSTL